MKLKDLKDILIESVLLLEYDDNTNDFNEVYKTKTFDIEDVLEYQEKTVVYIYTAKNEDRDYYTVVTIE